MTTNDAAQTVTRFCEEVLNAHNPGAVDSLVSEDFVELDPLPGQQPGRAGFQAWLAEWFAAFPDLALSIHEQITDGEQVVSRFSWSGTHQADFMGIPATGRPVEVNGVAIDRVVNEQMTESRMMMNSLSLLQQLGVISV